MHSLSVQMHLAATLPSECEFGNHEGSQAIVMAILLKTDLCFFLLFLLLIVGLCFYVSFLFRLHSLCLLVEGDTLIFLAGLAALPWGPIVHAVPPSWGWS